jgi:hypothetical protein
MKGEVYFELPVVMGADDLAAAIAKSISHENAPEFISLIEVQYQDFEVGQQSAMLILESLGREFTDEDNVEIRKEYYETLDKLRELLQTVP